MKENVRKKDPNSTNSTGVLPLYHPCAQTSGIIIYSDGRTKGTMNSKSRIETCFILHLSSSFLLQLFKTKSPKKASWPGILVSHKETRTKVVLERKLGKQGHSSSPDREVKGKEFAQISEFFSVLDNRLLADNLSIAKSVHCRIKQE